MAKKDFGDELLFYYNKWKQDPNHPYIPEFIDKLITVNFRKQNYKKFADFESDNFQEELHKLKLKCYQTLNKIQEPTAKRIYNYLDCTVRYGLMNAKKDLAKNIDRKQLKVDMESERVSNISISIDDSLLYLPEDQLALAQCILNRMTIKETCDELNLDTKAYKELKENLILTLNYEKQ